MNTEKMVIKLAIMNYLSFAFLRRRGWCFDFRLGPHLFKRDGNTQRERERERVGLRERIRHTERERVNVRGEKERERENERMRERE